MITTRFLERYGTIRKNKIKKYFDMKTIMEVLKFAQSQRDAIAKVEEIIAECSSFKIGKTGESLLDRLCQPDYAGIYSKITPIFFGQKEEVNDMESYLINKYINHSKCNNQKDGDASNNDTMAIGSEKYQVYIVWNKD